MSINYQQQYWDLVTEIRVQIGYLHLYQLDAEKRDKWVNMYVALASSGSIAGWAIWQNYGFIWAFIIAISQVINVIKGYLPWDKRVKNIAGAKAELEVLLISAERYWYDVSQGTLTTKEIHNLTVDIKLDRVKLEQKYFRDGPLPLRQDLMDEAEQQTAQTAETGEWYYVGKEE